MLLADSKAKAQPQKRIQKPRAAAGITKSRPKRGKHCLWTESSMVSAFEAVRNQHMSQWEACKTFGVPRTTLRDRLSGKVELGAKPGHPTLLSLEQETKVVDYACNRASLGIGFGCRQFLNYAGNFAKKYRITFRNRMDTRH